MEENKILVSPVNPSGYSTDLGTISVSNVYSSGYPGYYAFNETSGYWCTQSYVGDAWLQIEYKTPIRINAFEYLADFDSGYPYSLNFEGSQNGTSWDILYTADNIPVGKIEGSFENRTEYKFYKLNITRKRNSYITARGLKFFQYPIKDINFSKTLKNNLESSSFNGIPFVFTEDGDLYGIKENELKSIINPTKPYTQNVLFNSDITTDNTGQLSMDINDYDLLYFHLQGSGDKRSLMPDDMDSNSEQGYNLTASSVLKSSISDIYGMFNYGRNGGYPYGWYTEHGLPMPQWFMVEFPSPVTLNIWDYQTYYSDRRRPTVVSVQGSNDGIIFDDILTNYDVGAKGNATNHFIVKFKNNKKYKFYKMIINERDEKFEPEYGLAILTTYLYEEIKDNDNSSYLIPKELFNKNISSFNFANLSLSNTSLNITNVKKPFNLQIIGVKKGV